MSFKKNIIIIMFYKVLLDIVFVNYISPLWVDINYGKFQGINFRIIIFVISYLLAMIFTYFITKIQDKKRFSSITIIFLYMISFLPFLSMLGLGVFELTFVIENLVFWILLIWFYLMFCKYNFTIKTIKIKNIDFFGVLIIFISVLTTLIVGFYSGYRINLDLTKVYDFRFEAQEFNYSLGFEYIFGLSRILIPTGLVYFMIRKKYVIVLLMLTIALINYSFDGGKTVLLISFTAIIVALFFKEKYIKYILLSFPGLLIIGIIDYLFISGKYVFVIIVRRLLFVPNLINSYVIDYMANTKPNYFSQLLRFIGIENSNINLNYYIGDVYFNAPLMSANSGLISDAVWQLGIIGIFVFPLLIIVFLMMSDSVTKELTFKEMLIPALIFAYYLNNSGILAALFSHGLILFLVCLLFYRNKIRIKEVVQ